MFGTFNKVSENLKLGYISVSQKAPKTGNDLKIDMGVLF